MSTQVRLFDGDEPAPEGAECERDGSLTGNEDKKRLPPWEPKAFIDWLTIVGKPREDFFRWAEVSQTVRIMESRVQTLSDSWNLPSHGMFMQRTGRFFHGDKVLYLFNPARVGREFIEEVLGEHLIAERVSRVDVAIDYDADLNSAIFKMPRKKRTTHMTAGGDIEGLAFGTRGKSGYVRVYDKARERVR